MVTLAAADPGAPAVAALAAAARESVPGLVTLAVSRREPDAPQVIGAAPAVVVGAGAERHSRIRTHRTTSPARRLHPGAPRAARGPAPRRRGCPARRLGSLAERRVLELYAGPARSGSAWPAPARR
jgi:hypothetical protein